ncbi:MAG: PEGA domain-containing protein [Deltaproteobacteria bacterium]
MVRHKTGLLSRVADALRLGVNSRIPALAAILLVLSIPNLYGVKVRVPEGKLVQLTLRNDVTPDSVEKGGRVEFNVSSDVVINDEIAIAEGARAWGIVERAKGAGKKDARDASVTFRSIGVVAADSQPIPLRLMPSKGRKPDPADIDVEESSRIPGPGPRRVGAARGKTDAAYTDSDAFVDATVSVKAPAQAALIAAPPEPPPVIAAPPQPASVDFRSDPTGADVVVDGSSVGVTPTTQQLSPGLHDIEIHAQGCQNFKRKLRVEPGSHPTVMARMVPS